MASIHLSRMCCVNSDAGTELVKGFMPELYNALCLSGSLLGLLASGIWYICGDSREYSSRAVRMGGRIRVCGILATTGARIFISSPGILLRSILWLSAPDFSSNQTTWLSHTICILITAWIHYFCSVQFWSMFCYSLEVAQLFSPSPPDRLRRLYSFLCWGIPGLLWLHGVLTLLIPALPQDSCSSDQSLVLFHDILIYIPFLLALLVSPLLLRRAVYAVSSVLRMQYGVYTCNERFRKQSFCRRLLRISGTFIACWLGNVVCDSLLIIFELWGDSAPPRQLQFAVLTAWIITGILNPIYCCLHSLAFYGGWCNAGRFLNQSSIRSNAPSEITPESSQQGLLEEEHQLLGMEQPQVTGKLSSPNILQVMDSWNSIGFSCSAVEINAVRLLGSCESGCTTRVIA
ncbi:G-protein coupled receptor 143 [Bombina bombina]|uniref:G-protein coupled receptor 143 n=1 Tax=Bombina bombina TaxID=8345 RepID=UPI00235A6553|nr:G-protein coupled receptor 143 [Bombina bombina]